MLEKYLNAYRDLKQNLYALLIIYEIGMLNQILYNLQCNIHHVPFNKL
jgi:hypothetical protein